MTITNESGVVQTNYPLQFGRPFLDGAIADEPQVLINGSPVPTQADVKNRYPDGSVEFAVVAVMIPTIPASGSLTLTFQNQTAGNNTPLTQAQMLTLYYDFDAQISLTPASGPAQVADARKMLTNGDYKLWTAGPIAQTIMLGDDSTARKYDLGLGDGYHPFRPRFYATFWPATGQVEVRYVGENGNTQELEDLNYNLALNTANARAYTKSKLTHYALSTWTRVFWLGRTPQAMINIDHNLAYLASTHFVPNYDTSITVPSSAITNEYALWLNYPHDMYDGIWDGGQFLVTPMADAGAHAEIGPIPTWDVLWLYTGDWRMRTVALGATDNAGAFPANLREGATGKRLSRTDPVDSSTGLGHTVSITGRPTLLTYGALWVSYTYTKTADKMIVRGPINTNQPWTFDGAHEPSLWFIPYILTGDPWYLNEAYMWAGFNAATSDFPRGPGNGDYGIVTAIQPRGLAWVLRGRAETAFMAPDADPEKAYFTYLMNDVLAEWEGALGVSGTAFDGQAVKNWQIGQGNPMQTLVAKDPSYGTQPPLGNTSSICNAAPAAQCIYPATFNGTYFTPPGSGVPGVGNVDENFMEWYLDYAMGRIAELGFAAGPLQARTVPWLIGMINDSGYPCLVNQYMSPVEPVGGGWYQNWAAVIAAMEPSYLNPATSGGCEKGFAGDLGSEGYPLYALSGLSYATGEPGGAAAWSWLWQNAYVPALTQGITSNPKWDIAPRTDSNTLPAQPTAIPPS